jgi:hypothetical protein
MDHSDYHHALRQLVANAPEVLWRYDVAEMNLLCATGLPRSEHLDITECLATLDKWANRVRMRTNSELCRFRPNPRCPTEARYRCYMLIHVLRESYGLKHYLLPTKGTGITGFGIPRGAHPRFDDSSLLFIHGLLSEARIGSCSSLPVLYAAVGRRLGYPIRLVLSVQHVLIRWEDGREKFNMEGTGPDYISSDPDGSYIDKPRPWNGGGESLWRVSPIDLAGGRARILPVHATGMFAREPTLD